MKLSLGVWDMPYADKGGETTGAVAKELERKYGVMRHFTTMHSKEITDAVALAFAGAIGNVVAGQDPMIALKGAFMEASGEITPAFGLFLDRKEMDGMVGGVPTKASLMGRSSRHKSGMKAGPRPSFIDTGLYSASMTSEITGDE